MVCRVSRSFRRGQRRHFVSLRIEQLEDRCLLSSYTVNSTADSEDIIPGNDRCSAGTIVLGQPVETGVCTLRAAIEEAESTSAADTINFSIDSGTKTISLLSALPNITHPVTIDGTTQPGSNPFLTCIFSLHHPCIELTPNTAGADFDGLHITAGNTTVRGLVINRFGGDGIEFEGGSGNVINQIFIGTDVLGGADLGNGVNGVFINGSSNNTIGPSTFTAHTVISGNDFSGVRISGSGSAGNQVIGSFIGTNSDGTDALGNSADGVLLVGVSDNVIGGTSGPARNIISGNELVGVEISGFSNSAERNVVQGNFIGTKANGSEALPNLAYGVRIFAADDNTIGGTVGTTPGVSCTGACNLISGNSADGVMVEGINNPLNVSSNNRVLGNFIGTDVQGRNPVGNDFGVTIRSFAEFNTIGGTEAGEGNVISGNGKIGMYILGAKANLVQGNLIGTTANGNEPLGNALGGVQLLGAADNTLGGAEGTTPNGPCTGACNVISANPSTGVIIEGNNNTVQGNFIGTKSDGMEALGNNVGMTIHGENNSIGGTDPGTRNIISGNVDTGVRIWIGAKGNKLSGNFIGTDVNGSTAVPNGTGVSIDGLQNVVGGTDHDNGMCNRECNLISGNVQNGVTITANLLLATTDNIVQGNFIGTNLDGTEALGNGDAGVELSGIDHSVKNNTVGGTTAGARNLISGNRNGIKVVGDKARDNFVQGNYIGTGASGNSAVKNLEAGVFISGSSDNSIGGSVPEARNVISGNGSDGVKIEGNTVNANPVDAAGNQVLGNFIGTNAAGTASLANASSGVLLNSPNLAGFGKAKNNTIGGPNSDARNLISGNATGITISGTATEDNVIESNFIGTNPLGTCSLDAQGKCPLANTGDGVLINGAAKNSIGAADAGNVISGNGAHGIEIMNGASENQVLANRIGTTATGDAPLGNNFFGIRIADSSNNTVGGTVVDTRNVISANSVGVRLSGEDTVGNVVEGNFIGTDSTGMLDLGNLNEGVFLDNAKNNIIGGATDGAGNVISGNDASGVRLLDDKTTGNRVEGNWIGAAADGVTPLPNAGSGVYIKSASTNAIGGTATGAGNTIAFNVNDGVFIESGNAGATGDLISSNSIFSNSSLGIDLDPDGVTANDAGDGDPGPNNLQNFPELTTITSGGGIVSIVGTLSSTPDSSFTIEFFSNQACDPSGNGQGESFIGSTALRTAGNGNVAFTAAFSAVINVGEFVTATATESDNNTSEFSRCVQVQGVDLSVTQTDSPDPALPGGNVTYTLTVHNAGPLPATSVTLSDTLPDGAIFVSATPSQGTCNQSAGMVICMLDNLPVNAAATITIVVTPTASGTITNAVTVTAAEGELITTNNSTTENTIIKARALTLAVVATSIVENAGLEATTATLTRNNLDIAQSLEVTLVNDDPSEIEIPSLVTIPANEASITFDIRAVDDALLDGTQTVDITASAAGYASGSDALDVTDYEMLDVSIAVASIAENAGNAATTATVTRSNTDINQSLEVTLVNGDPSEIAIPSLVTIPANEASVTFDIRAVDDDLLDGTQTVTITASAVGYVSGSNALDVTDHETPWQNPRDPNDVSDDGIVVPLDVLKIVNELNSPRFSDPVTRKLPDDRPLDDPTAFYYDVNGDGFCTTNDALRTINFLNGMQGEGEGSDRNRLTIVLIEIRPHDLRTPVAVRQIRGPVEQTQLTTVTWPRNVLFPAKRRERAGVGRVVNASSKLDDFEATLDEIAKNRPRKNVL